MLSVEKLARKFKTPQQVQKFLRTLPYNGGKEGNTLRSAAEALRVGKAHCFEAAFIAAAILEKHGYPPLVVSLESQDQLDHVIYVYRRGKKWGAVSRSRDEGLHGRPPIYRSIRDLVWSYYPPYIDRTGRILAYQVANLDDSKADWRASSRNVWKAENYLLEIKHHKLKSSPRKYRKILKDFIAHGPMKPKKHWW